MKFLCDSTLFDAETGRCWKSTDSFTGYGNGYPEKIVIHNFEDLEDKPKLLYLEHIHPDRLRRNADGIHKIQRQLRLRHAGNQHELQLRADDAEYPDDLCAV